jgi:hypothetical protein
MADSQEPPVPPGATAKASGKTIDDLIAGYESRKADLAKTAETKKVIVALPKKFVASLLRIPFNLLARFDWPGWKLTPEEEDELADAWKPVLERYLPGVLLKYFPIILAIAVTLEVLAGKMKERQEWKKGEGEKDQEEAIERRVRKAIAKVGVPKEMPPPPPDPNEEPQLEDHQARLSEGAPPIDELWKDAKKQARRKPKMMPPPKALAITKKKQEAIANRLSKGNSKADEAGKLLGNLGGLTDGRKRKTKGDNASA